jgi:predicted nucleic acid-binding protein
MIAATSLLRGIPLATRDERLRDARALQTIW